ncbi:MAG: alpha/beta hydrolase, partial [Ignavibacteria bacterium]|nr:alpha/beta hydrolase [Ignavibacteria bacterium]
MKKIFAILLVFISFAILRAQPVVEGDWSGAIKIIGQELEIITHFKQGDSGISGTIDIPPQGAYGLKLSNFIHLHPDFSFELNVPNGLAKFDGHFSGDSIKGKFLQAGIEGTFYLTRGASVKPKKDTEEIKEKLPYKEEEVSFKNGENTFSGTLTMPEYPGKYPAVVMITGSGAQNRDEELFGFKPFRIIADHLTRNGIAVLRYDDRGTGKSMGKKVSESTTEEFAYDVIEAVKFLQTRKDINPGQIGLIGHSEGGVVGPLAASKYGNVDFVVCIAGTGV